MATLLIGNGRSGHLGPETLPTAARLFFWTNAWVVLANLWPHQPKTGFGMASDGARLLQLLSARKRALDEVQAMRFAFEANIRREQTNLAGTRAWCDKGLALYPDNAQLLNLSGINYLDEQE